ncbi:MAG: polyamine ABC transporter substrate-binding protein [Gammaproteobacteria bacterium]|nr:polyamine ABC transporter substrate-binding protein [Gammaproteobacteria bacterium]
MTARRQPVFSAAALRYKSSPAHPFRNATLKHTLSLVVLTFGLVASALGQSRQVVHVYNWSDYIAPTVLQAFTAETGIRVVYDVYDSNEILEAKLLTGRSGYDVVFPTARPFAARQVAAGAYRPLDRSLLPNLEHLEAGLMADLATIDPDNRHLLPYMWGTTGIGLVEEAVRARLGDDFELDTWDLIFDPAVASKLAGCGIAILDAALDALPAALFWQGLDPSRQDQDDVEAATRAFLGARPHVRYFHSSQYINDLANGDICVAMGYSGDVLQAAARAEETNRSHTVRYVIPREGAMIWTDVIAIPRDAPHPEAAHAFIDYLLRPEVIAEISNYVSYANANSAATELLDESIREDRGIYPGEEVRAKLRSMRLLTPVELRERTRAWTRIRRGR